MLKIIHSCWLFVLVAVTACTPADNLIIPDESGKELQENQTSVANKPLKILFIGNSYTFYNDLPKIFENLMISGGHEIEVDDSAFGGWSLSDHIKAPETLNKISGTDWDYVILQEQSLVENPENGMYPAIRDLNAKIQQTGAQTVLFMTWGRRDGFPSAGYPDYASMQSHITNVYSLIASELDLMVAPVGLAWQTALTEAPEINLWNPDNSHPSAAGTYLAACIFYAQITGKSPVGLNFTDSLSNENALLLQEIASKPEMLKRSMLTFEDLMSGFEFDAPVKELALTIPPNTGDPEHIFEGRLELKGESNNGYMQVYEGENLEPEVIYLPEFNFEFVQWDNYLIPIQRGLIITDHPKLNYFIEPGRVWQEDDDQGFTRASFPFAIVWKGSNAIMNGTMTFLFDEDEVSKVWYQITQETTISFSADLWGLLDAIYHPDPVVNSDKIKIAFEEELNNRFLTKPIDTLAEDYPSVDLSVFGRGVTAKNMTWFGFVINGINYVGGCQTRYGIYPYCEYMRAPSYSTAKSAFASLVLMRLAQKYDPNIPDFLIKDYIPEAADSIGDWSKVTFDHTLDMATGNYETSARMVDEEHWDTDPFWSEDYYAEKIAAAFNWPHSADPGTTWVYRTFDTFIVTRAMHNYLQTQEGTDADIFEFAVDEIYEPLQMGPGFFSTLRTKDNNWQGQPYGGYGLFWIPDDLAKISTFLNINHGTIDGQQILHPGLLDDALQRDPNDRGVDRDGNGKYNNAYWADQYGLKCKYWVPHMYGYSGIVIALIPNGTTYYYASDGQEFTTMAAIHESERVIPICGE